MPADVHLIAHNTIGIVSAVVAIALAVFALAKGYRKSLNVTFALVCITSAIFLVSHVLGVSEMDPVASHNIFKWNVVVIAISMFSFHSAMAGLRREHALRWLIGAVYVISIAFMAVFLIYPETFLLDSVPKMYFPNYYVPGTFHWLMRLIFQIILPIYIVYELARAYRQDPNPVERNRSLYFGFFFGFGWLLGFIPIPLIFDIPLDPMWGLFFPIVSSVPFTYAVIHYELLDIRIIAKKAFLYALAVIGTGAFITIFDVFNQWLLREYPGFPVWLAPGMIAIIIVWVGVIVWRQLREGEILKYEFITTVTHKFRTPLTHIKWATENLKQIDISVDQKEQIGYIENANSKLVELTDLLANASETDENLYQYHLEKGDLVAIADQVIRAMSEHVSSKKIALTMKTSGATTALFDGARLKFVLQTLVENALNYTPDGGTVNVNIAGDDKETVFSVCDNGIGIPKSEMPLIFTKLYRGHRARSIDTEGMGIGLYISKGILTRHHGRIWVESEGESKGSKFSFSLPAAK